MFVNFVFILRIKWYFKNMNIITDVVLPIALAFIMFSLGLGLSINDFTRIFLKPKEFFIGFF